MIGLELLALSSEFLLLGLLLKDPKLGLRGENLADSNEGFVRGRSLLLSRVLGGDG